MDLRQSLRQKRRALSIEQREQAAKKIVRQCRRLKIFSHAKKVAIFFENDGEIGTKYLIEFLQKNGVRLYLPIVIGERLHFAPMTRWLKKNRFGIDEPQHPTRTNIRKIHLILIPLVGFDAHKNRLGMGGGYYDKTLAFRKSQNTFKNPKLYGLAFDCQKVSRLAPKPWDVGLDGVITEAAVYR